MADLDQAKRRGIYHGFYNDPLGRYTQDMTPEARRAFEKGYREGARRNQGRMEITSY